MKTAVLGAGLRTPLLIHALARAQSELALEQLWVYDTDFDRAKLMEALGGEIAKESGLRVKATPRMEEAVEGCKIVLSSIRVGGMEARATDERISLAHGFAGQETTGPAGMAMALRTIPVALEQAHMVTRLAPEAWIVNFTNPAGLITQAIATHSGARVVGICDTPAELFFRIALALGEPLDRIECGYFGLNHLGWVNSILRRGEDVTDQVLGDDSLLRSLYPAELFSPALIRALRLIPTEYLFFYYDQPAAVRNQRLASATRGEELCRMNTILLRDLSEAVRNGKPGEAVQIYKNYLNQRNGSYLRLEGAGESAFQQPQHDWDPFEGATGYHRIALDVMRALCGAEPARIVLNVQNEGAVDDLAWDDVVEVPCVVDHKGATPAPFGCLPGAARNLVLEVKAYERLTIRAAVEQSLELTARALAANPIVADWHRARHVLLDLVEQSPTHLEYLKKSSKSNHS